MKKREKFETWLRIPKFTKSEHYIKIWKNEKNPNLISRKFINNTSVYQRCEHISNFPFVKNRLKIQNIYFVGMEEKSVLKLRSHPPQSPGFQAVSVIFAVEGDDEPSNICALSINTNWGICVVGTTNGVIVIDYIQHKKILAMSTMDLLRYFN